MKKALIVAIAVLGFGMHASALDVEAITAKPTANNSQYDNKEAWPDLVGDKYFLKEEWPKAWLLIWAHAATAPVRGEPRPDIADPASWIDAATGNPADTVPDMHTDVILPDDERPYSVSGSGFICRHLTVGRNADFQPGGGRSASVFGNVWIRPRRTHSRVHWTNRSRPTRGPAYAGEGIHFDVVSRKMGQSDMGSPLFP
ncbi:MAG: hypothetical protein HQ581_12610 [Planctomycetes bacterium]|nr:hypothetical protein [Planctomycetota bacterium]